MFLWIPTMDTQKKIQHLVQIDSQMEQIGQLAIAHTRKDWNHLQRRQQQRAISEPMMRVALAYGKKRYDRGALVYTLNERILKHSPYAKFTDVLRGLTVVCLQETATPQILTAYWHYGTCQRVRK
jgi:hypothetical protein